MKRFSAHTAVFAALFVTASMTTPAAAAGKCDHPNGPIERRACAKAVEGPEALRRFVERTRAIYLLYYFDYAKGDAVAAAATTSTKVAEVKAP